MHFLILFYFLGVEMSDNFLILDLLHGPLFLSRRIQELLFVYYVLKFNNIVHWSGVLCIHCSRHSKASFILKTCALACRNVPVPFFFHLLSPDLIFSLSETFISLMLDTFI